MCRMNLGHHYDYEELVEYGKYLQERYSHVLEVSTIGMSYDNRKIPIFQIGSRPNRILMTGGVHGREIINPVVLMKMIEDFCILEMDQKTMLRLKKKNLLEENNRKHFFLKRFILQEDLIIQDIMKYEKYKEISFSIIPLVNPDGYEIAQKGFQAIRNQELRERIKDNGIDYREWKFNGRGVDINRNFPSKTWRKKFEGDTPGSERETIAVMSVMDTLKCEAYLDFHSRGRVIYYFRNGMDLKYNLRQKKWAKEIHKKTGYRYMKPSREIDENDSGGNTVHYFSEKVGGAAITIETVAEKVRFPMDAKWQKKTYKEIKDVPYCKF